VGRVLQIETIRANVVGCLTLADVCNSKDIHMTYYGTGCIFHYDDEFKVNTGKVRVLTPLLAFCRDLCSMVNRCVAHRCVRRVQTTRRWAHDDHQAKHATMVRRHFRWIFLACVNSSKTPNADAGTCMLLSHTL
jgi:hypothetical protein